VAVEKLFRAKFAKIKLRQDALQTTFSIFLDIFYPPNFRCFEENGVFQHPRLFTTPTQNILSCITSNVHMSSSETHEFSDEFVTQELDQVHPQDARIISLRKRSQTCKYITAWL
jgi:hypothetical protein